MNGVNGVSGGASGSWEAWDADPNIPTPLSDSSDSAQPSALSLDYYRGKVREFQQVLYALDLTGRDLYEAGTVAYASGDADAVAAYESLQADYDAKRSQFVTVAEGIQLASQGINAAGVEFPQVQIPFGLGAVPLVPLAAAAGVVAAAVALITWASEFFRAVREFAQRAQHLSAIMQLPEGERASSLEKLRKLELTAQQSELATQQSPLQSLATIAKWGAVAAVAFFAYRAFVNSKG